MSSTLRHAIRASVRLPKPVYLYEYRRPVGSYAGVMVGVIAVLIGCAGLIWMVSQGDLQVIPAIRYPWPWL